MAYGDTFPVLGGTTLRRPTSVSQNAETLRREVVLAAGGLRSYSSGVRAVFELSWAKLREEEVVALRMAAAPPFTSYTHVDGTTRVVETSAPQETAIAGTFPVRFSVSITLRAQEPTR
jgi:hypothetical protein